MIAGTLPVSEFFSEANLGRILAGAGWQVIRRAAELASVTAGPADDAVAVAPGAV